LPWRQISSRIICAFLLRGAHRSFGQRRGKRVSFVSRIVTRRRYSAQRCFIQRDLGCGRLLPTISQQPWRQPADNYSGSTSAKSHSWAKRVYVHLEQFIPLQDRKKFLFPQWSTGTINPNCLANRAIPLLRDLVSFDMRLRQGPSIIATLDVPVGEITRLPVSQTTWTQICVLGDISMFVRQKSEDKTKRLSQTSNPDANPLNRDISISSSMSPGIGYCVQYIPNRGSFILSTYVLSLHNTVLHRKRIQFKVMKCLV